MVYSTSGDAEPSQADMQGLPYGMTIRYLNKEWCSSSRYMQICAFLGMSVFVFIVLFVNFVALKQSLNKLINVEDCLKYSSENRKKLFTFF